MNPLRSHPALRFWFAGRKACVVGLGKSGAAAVNLLHALGAAVHVTDGAPRAKLAPWMKPLPRGVSVEAGSHRSLAREWDFVVVSPGVHSDVWRPVAARGIPVMGEMELGYRVAFLAGRLPSRIAAVTGTNGKTTTTALLGAIFEATGQRTIVAGNIGMPLCARVEDLTADSILVLEVSSYQLESMSMFRPHAGAILNVTPDHLGRHKTLENYAAAKFRLFQSQTPADAAILNAGDELCRRFAWLAPGRKFWFGKGGSLRVDGNRLVSHLPGAGGSWPHPRFLPGRHNLENALAAAGLARLLGAPSAAVRRAFRNFRGVEHRLEEVRQVRGVRYINDSKATNVDSTQVALQALDRNLFVIMGGEDKGAPYTPLRNLVHWKAKAVLLIGEAAPKIEKDLKGAARFLRCGTLENAVRAAAGLAKPGDAVLLSPACASFDQFDNFEHRGRAFKHWVNALA